MKVVRVVNVDVLTEEWNIRAELAYIYCGKFLNNVIVYINDVIVYGCQHCFLRTTSLSFHLKFLHFQAWQQYRLQNVLYQNFAEFQN